jgi:hypothetical protein
MIRSDRLLTTIDLDDSRLQAAEGVRERLLQPDWDRERF